MATGQSILDLMEVINRDLQLQSGEADVTKGLLAANAAQDHFEALVAQRPGVLGDTIGTVSTAASTESTTFPTGLLRLDGMQYIDSGTSRPAWDLQPLYDVGGHAWKRYWPENMVSTATTGKPRAYWTDGKKIYWDPEPDATYTVRWYGFQVASDITAGGTFAYPDICMRPFATFAAKLFQIGLDDPTPEYDRLALEVFTPVLDTLSRFRRETGKPAVYSIYHEA